MLNNIAPDKGNKNGDINSNSNSERIICASNDMLRKQSRLCREKFQNQNQDKKQKQGEGQSQDQIKRKRTQIPISNHLLKYLLEFLQLSDKVPLLSFNLTLKSLLLKNRQVQNFFSLIELFKFDLDLEDLLINSVNFEIALSNLNLNYEKVKPNYSYLIKKILKNATTLNLLSLEEYRAFELQQVINELTLNQTITKVIINKSQFFNDDPILLDSNSVKFFFKASILTKGSYT